MTHDRAGSGLRRLSCFALGDNRRTYSSADNKEWTITQQTAPGTVQYRTVLISFLMPTLTYLAHAKTPVPYIVTLVDHITSIAP